MKTSVVSRASVLGSSPGWHSTYRWNLAMQHALVHKIAQQMLHSHLLCGAFETLLDKGCIQHVS